jgi:hypothetical protein
LKQFRTRLEDGTPVWRIVDAVVTTTPDGEPAWLKLCDGEEAAAFYGSETVGGRYIATAAWSANPDATALDTVDPASITCYDTGD